MDSKRGSNGAWFADVRDLAAIWRALLCGLIWIALSCQVQAETPCVIPDALAPHDISLPNTSRAVADGRRLVVLTFGGVSPAGAEAETHGATWPARLEAALRVALPGIKVDVANAPPPGRTSADVPPVLPGLIASTGANLVIWGPGGRDVMERLNPDTFLNAVKSGINAVRKANADLILLDTTFVPSPARMLAIETYRDRLLTAAAIEHVPVFRRHDMMRRWSEDGTLNLAARDPAERELVVRRLFACVAQGLAAPIAAAVK